MTDSQDFSSAPPSPPTRAVHYDLELQRSESLDFSHSPASHAVHRDLEAGRSESETLPKNNTFKTRQTFESEPDISNPNAAPIIRRRQTRTNTAKTFRAVNAYPIRPNWHPGQEPGLDPSKPNGGRAQRLALQADCDITVVDYSEDDMVMRHLDNKSLLDWLEKDGTRDEWAKCRWININGLSWDVIQALGSYKRLHRLALEDLVNTRNRTKADWYSDHTYIVMTLQKLVHIHPDEVDSEDGCDDEYSAKEKRLSRLERLKRKIHRVLGRDVGLTAPLSLDGSSDGGDVRKPSPGFTSAHSEAAHGAPAPKLRTLQRYHGGPNQERMAFMEEKSLLTAKNLAVCAEQVSIFLTSDNTVISFFESSAEDVETPILNRLSTPDTILRRSCDASMLTQAIIDAIIDLAIPVTTLYQDIIGELELDVLTDPDLKHTKSLYITTAEITTMRNFVNPIASLIHALRDHKMEQISASVLPDKTLSASSGIEISRMTRTYLGDVEDHCILIVQALDQMNSSAAGMIDLIFNTISAYQNESMKQLTVVTIIFLPMSFLTGYFGMNLQHFPSLNNDEGYFWSIAMPVAFGVVIFLMRNIFWRWFVITMQRAGISRRKKGRLQREAAGARAAAERKSKLL